MYEDLVSGVLGSPGLVDAAAMLGASGEPVRATTNQIQLIFIDFIKWFFTLLPQFSAWVRSEPLVLAVVAFLVTGFVASIFFRIYHSV